MGSAVASWSWPGSLVTGVIDGDTVDVQVKRDIGFGGQVQFPVRLRLNRIDASAKSTAIGARAAARVRDLIGGRTVDLETLKPYAYGGPTDTPGEWMTEITLPDGRNLSDVLLAEGLAVSYDGKVKRPSATITQK